MKLLIRTANPTVIAAQHYYKRLRRFREIMRGCPNPKEVFVVGTL